VTIEGDAIIVIIVVDSTAVYCAPIIVFSLLSEVFFGFGFPNFGGYDVVVNAVVGGVET
jgi:hypothetical protein